MILVHINNPQNSCLVRDHSSKYYVGFLGSRGGGQMMLFDDKVGGWGWLNADVHRKNGWNFLKKTLFSGKMNQN